GAAASFSLGAAAFLAAGFLTTGASSASAFFLLRLGVASASSASAMALSSAWDKVAISESFLEVAAFWGAAASFFTATAGVAFFAAGAGALATAMVLDVLGFAEAMGACLDFADFETGMHYLLVKSYLTKGKRKRHLTRRMDVLKHVRGANKLHGKMSGRSFG